MLTVLVTLNLNDHLLETIDGLVATLVRELILEVTLSTLLVCASAVLILVGNVLLGVRLQLVLGDLCAGGGINSGGSVVLLITSCELGSVTRVTRSRWVGGLSGITKSILGLVSAERLLLVVVRLGLVLEVVPAQIRNVVPRVVVLRLVNLVELILRGVDLVCGLLSCITSHVPKKHGGILDCDILDRCFDDTRALQLTKLAELSVAQNKLSKSAKTLKSLVSVLLSSLLVNRCARSGGVSTRELLRLPCKVLDKVALVLGEKKDLCLLDDIAEIGDKILAFSRELLTRARQ